MHLKCSKIGWGAEISELELEKTPNTFREYP